MDRRESIKSILVGSLSAGAIVGTAGCAPGENPQDALTPNKSAAYGRTDKEKAHDLKVMSETFLTEYELGTIAILCDLILPAEDGFKAATEAEVPDFIEFIVKDIPNHQLPLRGGLMWLDNFANATYNLTFSACSTEQQKGLLDQIAFPMDEPGDLAPGIAFFSLIRNLTLTGFYTSKIGVEELGYKGNTPNVWDGVPDEVLKKHGFSYEDGVQYVDQSKRSDIAMWDDEGNLLT